MAGRAYTNQLIREKSPYLLQHAHNPVDWYPWGSEAFAKARQEGKIVFLSVGYSTCHWCHVMERESFEDEETAAVINTVSVPVKVDREERPDVDQVYMAVCQALTGNGGWPLTVLLTPEGTPFFAGTYFPRESRYGRIGLQELLRRAAALWKEDPDKVRASARDIIARLSQSRAPSGDELKLDNALFGSAVDVFRSEFDEARGGFGPAPKFPTPHNLTFLLRRYRRTGDETLLRIVEKTLDGMARGGIFDHVGFGFHRYSTDPEWLVPHFEKMLYDQAGLAQAYLDAFQVTGRKDWAEVARKTIDYVLRDMADPAGGFHSAEDADSEGVEGKFYVWTRREVLGILGPGDADIFSQAYGVQPGGNFLPEAAGEVTDANILHLPRPLSEVASTLGLSLPALEAQLERCRLALFEARRSRVRPGKDDKIIAAWNGLMVSALSRASAVLGRPDYAEAANRASDFVLSALWRDSRLLRRYRAGEAAIPAFAEDYAFLAQGLLDLYAATFAPERLRQAMDLAWDLIRLFWDEGDGGLFDTASDSETLVLRPKEIYDGATPSASSVALEVFSRLALLTGDPGWQDRAQALADSCASRVARYPAGFTQFLQGAALLLDPTREVIIVGNPGSTDTEALLSALRQAYAPETQALLVSAEDPADPVRDLAPFTANMKPAAGRAAAYVCQNYACQAPLTSAEELRRVLQEPPP